MPHISRRSAAQRPRGPERVVGPAQEGATGMTDRRTTTGYQRVETAVRAIAEGISAATGEAFFRSLMQYLAKALTADYAFVGEMSPEQDNMIRTVAVCTDGQIAPNFAYDLRDTPCNNVTSGTLCVYPDRIQSHFPHDRSLAEMGIEGYVGIPLLDSQDHVIGLMVMLSRRPLAHPELCVSTLRIFATRAAAELERKQAEEAVRASEHRWRTMFDNAAIGIALVDAAGQPVHSNPALQRMLGYTAEELRRMSFVEFTHPDDATKDWALASEVFEGQRDSYQIEKRYIRKDGQVRWGHLTVSAIRDGNGSYQFGLGMIEDSTERKQAEEALRLSEECFTKAFHASPEPIAIYRQLDGTLLEVNERWTSTYGYTRAEAIGRTALELQLIKLEDRQKVRRLLEVQGFVRDFEVELTNKQGEVRYTSVSAEQIVINDDPCYIFLQRDITERKQAEEQLRATSAQLRALMARLRSAREQEGIRIAREIHDELGSALTSLRWDLEAIDKTISEVEDWSLMPALREKIGTMVGLIDTTIHGVRRISSELRPPILDDLGLAAAIEWQTQQFQARTGIMCQYVGAVEHLDLDQEQSTASFRIFQEALTNVLRHAQATRVDVTLEEAGAELVLKIRDNGRGITEGEQGGPPALGLLGMRERAHLIGGRIDLTGIRGQGTTVTLHVPHSSDQRVKSRGLCESPGSHHLHSPALGREQNHDENPCSG